MSPNETKEDGEYKIYKYPYTQLASETKILYIMIISIGNYDLKYFSFILNSGREGLSGGIIALIVILSIIVVLVVAYFVLRKLGIISFSIFTYFKK